MPNCEPMPEPHQIEARTFSFGWKDKSCDCKCDDGNKYKRDEIESRNIGWIFPIIDKYKCEKECKNKCDDYNDDQEKVCEKGCDDSFKKCWDDCKSNKDHKRNSPCQSKCNSKYKDDIKSCDKKWGH